MLQPVIYFDHNASSPMLPQARQVWIEASEKFFANPSSPHRLGSRAENALNDARERLGRILGCSPLDLVFTSGATEANNQVFFHFARALPGTILVSEIEHPSVLAAARAFCGERLKMIPVGQDGMVDVELLDGLLKNNRGGAVVVMAANNETGVIQPWGLISDLCRSYEIPYFCDATQWIGKMPATGIGKCDFLSGSAHKFGGPRGTGFLKCPSTGSVTSLVQGGPQEENRRAGTENVPGVLAMVAALEIREQHRPDLASELLVRRNIFESNLLAALPEVEIVAQSLERLWNTVMALMPKTECQQRWVVKLDKLGFAVSTGSACASGKEVPSHVLRAMGLPDEKASRALRFSSGVETSNEEWNGLCEALVKVHHTLSRTERV